MCYYAKLCQIPHLSRFLITSRFCLSLEALAKLLKVSSLNLCLTFLDIFLSPSLPLWCGFFIKLLDFKNLCLLADPFRDITEVDILIYFVLGRETTLEEVNEGIFSKFKLSWECLWNIFLPKFSGFW